MSDKMKEYIEREAVLSKLRNHYPKPDDMIASVVTIPAADVVEVEESEIEIVKFGIGPLVLLRCKSCGDAGWWGTLRPKFCVNCGKKFVYGGVNDAAD